MKKIILALTLMAMSSTVFAGHCRRDAAAIDAALAKVTLTAEQKTQIEKLKTDGLALHDSGDHRNSEKALAEAMRLVLENM